MTCVRNQITKKKLSKGKQLFVDQIRGQKQLVSDAFKVLERSYIAWLKEMENRIVACEENSPNWSCGNPHQKEIYNLQDAAEKFALKMGVPSYDFVMERVTELHNKILDKVEDDALL